MALQKFTVSRDDSIYEAWPDLIKTEKGKLICVFSECAHHMDREGARIMITESYDRGRTWTQKKPLTEKCSRDFFVNCARICRLKDGRLAILYDKTHPREAKSEGIYIHFGDSEGEHWEAPIHLPFNGIVPDKLLQLECGRMILAAHIRSGETGKLEQYLWYSDDEGKTWSNRVTIAADPALNLCEVSILPYDDHTLVAFLRENSREGYPILKVISYDNGETWSPIYHTPMDSGHRPVSGYLQDGTVMVSYRYIPQSTQNLFAAILRKEDLLKTNRKEQRCRIFPVDFDRNPDADQGYTGWVQFDDGEIYMVNYIKDDADLAYIRGYSFYPSDYILPRTETATATPF